jgi:hypothetical protein
VGTNFCGIAPVPCPATIAECSILENRKQLATGSCTSWEPSSQYSLSAGCYGCMSCKNHHDRCDLTRSEIVLVQPEMEERRSPLVSITLFQAGIFKAWGLTLLPMVRRPIPRPHPSCQMDLQRKRCFRRHSKQRKSPGSGSPNSRFLPACCPVASMRRRIE